MTKADGPAVLFVVGPTATGKSALAARLAAALGGEVISADSVQVYRYFDVGSGKPTAEERGLAPHHLIDIADPLEPIEAQVWATLAAEKIAEIQARGQVPIVCGGTFLWVRALLFGLAQAPPADPLIRKRHSQQAQDLGRPSLHRALELVDPMSAARLHPNDLVRVSRALEVHELTGRPLSEIQQEHGFRKPRYQAHFLALAWEAQQYEERLATRTERMVQGGFRDEVRSLVARGYEGSRAMDAVGYRQVKEAVNAGDAGPSDQELALQITRATRIFARRQRTWLRDEPVQQVPSSVLVSEGEFSVWSEKLRVPLERLRST